MLISLSVFIASIAVSLLMMLGVVAVMSAYVVVVDTVIIGIHVVPAAYVLASRTHAVIDVLFTVVT